MEFLAGAQDGRGEVWLVGGIGEVLGFEAEAAVFAVGDAGGTLVFAVEEVAGVELHAGFGGVDFQHAAGRRFAEPRC